MLINHPHGLDPVHDQSPSAVTILLATDEARQVLECHFSNFELQQLLWLLDLIEFHGLDTVENAMITYLSSTNHDQIIEYQD